MSAPPRAFRDSVPAETSSSCRPKRLTAVLRFCHRPRFLTGNYVLPNSSCHPVSPASSSPRPKIAPKRSSTSSSRLAGILSPGVERAPLRMRQSIAFTWSIWITPVVCVPVPCRLTANPFPREAFPTVVIGAKKVKPVRLLNWKADRHNAGCFPFCSLPVDGDISSHQISPGAGIFGLTKPHAPWPEHHPMPFLHRSSAHPGLIRPAIHRAYSAAGARAPAFPFRPAP